MVGSKFGLIVLLQGLTIIMSAKLLILNSNIADIDTIRLKIDPIILELHTFQDLRDYIKTLRNLGNEKFDLERLSNKSGKYMKVSNDDEILWNFNHITILVVQPADPETTSQLCIQGRSFSLSNGLQIGSLGYKLRISELEQASLGTGLNIWDGSIVLAKYLETHSELVIKNNVLELGAGTGVAGIAAGLLGARSVLLTDLEYTLDNLRRNADDNFAQMAPLAPMTSPSSVTSSKDQQPVNFAYRVAALDWADSSTYPNVSGVRQPFDVILGADIVWLEHLVPLLVSTLVACMGENTLLLLSHQTRSERTDKLLFDSLNQYFVINKIHKDEHHPEFQSNKISIYSGFVKKTSS